MQLTFLEAARAGACVALTLAMVTACATSPEGAEPADEPAPTDPAPGSKLPPSAPDSPADAGTHRDAATRADAGAVTDAAAPAEMLDAGAKDAAVMDAGGPVDGGGGCVTNFVCEAEAADHACGEPSPGGWRYPDDGTPWCSSLASRPLCSCDTVRCTTPLPLCPGKYEVAFREALLVGCNATPNDLGGTCSAAWNVVETIPGALVVEQYLYNVTAPWTMTDHTQTFTLSAPTLLRLRVQQSAWIKVGPSKSSNAGGLAVDRITVTKTGP